MTAFADFGRRLAGAVAIALCGATMASLRQGARVGTGSLRRRASRTLLATLPSGSFPGVDTTDLYEFLEAHAPRA